MANVAVSLRRSEEPPRRHTRTRGVRETEEVAAQPGPKARRATDLSEENHRSVMHTLRPDLRVGTEVVLG